MKNNKQFKRNILTVFVAATLAGPAMTTAVAAEASKAENANKAADKEADKTIAEIVKDHKEYKGLITVYQDEKTGAVLLKLNKKQLGKEFIHASQALDGVNAYGGFERGSYMGTRLYTFEHVYDRIEVRGENPHFYFDEKNALSKAEQANINRPIVASLKIKAQDEETGDLLIEGNELLLTEALQQLKPSANPESKSKGPTLGKLSKDKTKFVGIHNYDANTDFSVEYVYDSPAPVRHYSSDIDPGFFAITDDRSITFKVRHSFIERPQNAFVPRRDDSRLGYFTQYKYDMTNIDSAAPYRDVINRWHLEKKDPNATISEPVEPIVWWIENTTPVEYREIIKNAALAWNSSFEKAGFKNAVQVKIQPDDATWDAGDLRYNVLRWTASPRAFWSGYGPSFADPRTGQIIGADIMLDLGGLKRRDATFDIFAHGNHAYSETHNHLLATDNHAPIHEVAQIGQAALNASGVKSAEKERFVKEYLYYLTLHEVGHTLGLNHNMKATQMHSLDKVQSIKPSDNLPLAGSVMDYPAINFAFDGNEQGSFFTTQPGPYDDWIITYGYSQGLDDAAAEEARLEKILSRSTEKDLAFGNDADDMRAPGKGIDPRINIYDMSSDAIGYAVKSIELSNSLFDKLLENSVVEGESYQGLRNDFVQLVRNVQINAGVISRYIGGVYIDRGLAGQEGASTPFTPVPKADQKRAMEALSDLLFSPSAFKVDEKLAQHLQNQRRGFFNGMKNEDLQIHELVLATQKSVLNQLLHPVVLERIVDTELYGNDYTLEQVFADLTNAIFKKDSSSNVNSFRQNLQREYVERLIRIANQGKSTSQQTAYALARHQLVQIKRMIAKKKGNTVSEAHKAQLIYVIEKALDPRSA
ncbi:zinc-dependent metalloprotease (plasmid) [Pseudoalteromonas sp. T1lg65]|uniref:zinc-dependent metalloprotease n=1 Tax=Pseudoalteromonas sp. T1lg65 TaxID=2077101 RepID=UPI003F79D09D